jgi:hypothetical protein
MTHLQVKPLAVDKSNETLYISKELNLEAKKVKTPIVSLDASLVTQKDQLAPCKKRVSSQLSRRQGYILA